MADSSGYHCGPSSGGVSGIPQMRRDGVADLRDEMSRWPSGPFAFISYQDRKAVAATLNEIYQIYNAKDLLDAHKSAAPALPHRPLAHRALQADDMLDA